MQRTRCVISEWRKNTSADDVGIYCESLRELFLQPNKQQFEIQLQNKIKGYINNSGNKIDPWSAEFTRYFNNNIQPEIESLAAWSIKPICRKFFNNFSGVTTNQSEGLNNLLKIINERIELPLDLVILSVQQLSIFYTNEIKIGFGNRGNYRLRPEFREICFVDTRFISTRETMSPSEIIKSLIEDKEQLLKLAGVKFTTISASEDSSSTEQSSNNEDETNSIDVPQCDSPETISISSNTVTSTLRDVASESASDNEADEELAMSFEFKNRFNSKISRALWMVKNNKVKLVLDLKIYLVQDEKKQCFPVNLLPKANCSCLGKIACAHILAVESINCIDSKSNYKIPNISKLVKSKNNGITG
ncbi:unnamed protein product, partial [Brachionus calyciflorus]